MLRKLKIRKPPRYTGIRKRNRSLSSNEQVICRDLEDGIMNAAILKEIVKDEADIKILDQIIYISANEYLNLMIDPDDELNRPSRPFNFNLEAIEEDWSYEFLRIRKRDLRRFYDLMQFPPVIKFDNSSTMSGEEVFIRGMYELVTGEKKSSIVDKLGRHVSDQCRAFSYFIHHMYEKFHHLVDNNLTWWFQKGHIARSAELIGKKLELDRFNYVNQYALFIDCNVLETSRPGGGPCEGGANAMRWSEDVQRAFYNGWKSIHGLKHQTIDCAYGMTVDIYGPTSNRRNDLTLLALSEIKERVAEQCSADYVDMIYYIFGDSAYHPSNNLRSYWPDAPRGSFYYYWNSAMKRTRISIEWNYMRTATLFRYVGNPTKLQILRSSSRVSRTYIVCTILRNFLVCLYGSETSNYFNHIFPEDFLERYISQT